MTTDRRIPHRHEPGEVNSSLSEREEFPTAHEPAPARQPDDGGEGAHSDSELEHKRKIAEAGPGPGRGHPACERPAVRLHRVERAAFLVDTPMGEPADRRGAGDPVGAGMLPRLVRLASIPGSSRRAREAT